MAAWLQAHWLLAIGGAVVSFLLFGGDKLLGVGFSWATSAKTTTVTATQAFGAIETMAVYEATQGPDKGNDPAYRGVMAAMNAQLKPEPPHVVA